MGDSGQTRIIAVGRDQEDPLELVEQIGSARHGVGGVALWAGSGRTDRHIRPGLGIGIGFMND